ENATSRKPFPVPIPVGRHDYCEWLKAVGDTVGKRKEAEMEIAHVEKTFREFVEIHRPRLKGRKIIIVNKMSVNHDWLLEILTELGVEIPLIAFLAGPRMAKRKFVSRYEDMITREYPVENLDDDVKRMKPDMVLCDTVVPVKGDFKVAKLGRVGVGVKGTYEFTEYLENILRLPVEEGWRRRP
ncbi:MAG: hypothetical protein MJZ68_09680, partial [archaeon]|nr:hypothetical protein [archaeon]